LIVPSPFKTTGLLILNDVIVAKPEDRSDWQMRLRLNVAESRRWQDPCRKPKEEIQPHPNINPPSPTFSPLVL
jgi:hypothetical protein